MRYRNRPAAQALLAFLLCFGIGAYAQEDPQPASLTLRDAVAKAVDAHPGVRAARADIDIAAAYRDAAALPPAFEFQADVENVAGTGAASGLDAAETTVGLSRVVELGDKRHYREDLGNAQLASARIAAQARELELAAQVATRYVAVLQRQQQVALADEAVRIADRALDIVVRRGAAGSASQAELSAARVTKLQKELAARSARLDLATARAALADLWRGAAGDVGRVAGDIFALPPAPSGVELAARLEQAPELKRLDAAGTVLDAERQLAGARQRANVEFGAGVRHLAATDDAALVMSFSVPFGARRRAEPLLRAARGRVEQAPLLRAERRLELTTRLRELSDAMDLSRLALTALQTEIIPEAELSLRYYERGLEAGANSLLELTAAQERLLVLRRDALDAAASYHRALVRLDTLLGAALPGGERQ